VSGWGRREIATLWALFGVSYGLASTAFGGTNFLARMIARGGLDAFLALPRPVFLHSLVSRMTLNAWGDIGFGWLVFFVFVQPSAAEVSLFALLCLSNVGIFVGF